MATSFVQLGSNDSLDSVIRKCNENFRALSADQEKSTASAIRQEGAATQLKIDESVNSAIQQINQLLASAKDEISKEIIKATADVCPSVGQQILWRSGTLPAQKWPGTEWIDEGNWMLVKDPVLGGEKNPEGYQSDNMRVHVWHRVK